MSSAAQHLEAIEALCARPFPAGPVRRPDGHSGPRHHLLVLGAADEDAGDPAEREEIEDQFEAERDALALLLEVRGWGAPQRFALWSLAIRAHAAREEIPAPWAELAQSVPDLCLWRRADRWAGLGTTRTDPELPVRLLAFATVTDPP